VLRLVELETVKLHVFRYSNMGAQKQKEKLSYYERLNNRIQIHNTGVNLYAL